MPVRHGLLFHGHGSLVLRALGREEGCAVDTGIDVTEQGGGDWSNDISWLHG